MNAEGPSESLDLWRWLVSEAARPLLGASLEAVTRGQSVEPATVEALRRLVPSDAAAGFDPNGGAGRGRAVSLALELAWVRRRAARKWPSLASSLVADRAGFEMASSESAALHTASRFARAGRPVADLCSGIGGNAAGLARAGVGVVAFDTDPLRVWMASRNAGVAARCVDVTDAGAVAATLHAAGVDPDGALAFADPARRTGGGHRRGDPESGEPPLSALEPVIGGFRGAGVKLAPGVDADRLAGGEVEVIGEISGGRRTLTQAVWWSGELSAGDGVRTATRLPEGATLRGRPIETPVSALEEIGPGDVLWEVGPEIERAGLMGVMASRLGGSAVADPGTGLLVGEPAASDRVWLRGHRVLEIGPGRADRLSRLVGRHRPGRVTVRTRGGFVPDPQRLAERLSGRGGRRLTAFVMRFGSRAAAVVCESVSGDENGD